MLKGIAVCWGGGAQVSLLFWQFAVSIEFSEFTKVQQAAMLAHCFCLSKVVGRGTNTLRIHMAVTFSAECKHSATAERLAALHEPKQQCGLDFARLAQHSQQLQLFGKSPLPGSKPSLTPPAFARMFTVHPGYSEQLGGRGGGGKVV